MTTEKLKEKLNVFEHDDREEWINKKKELREYLLQNGEKHFSVLLESLKTDNQQYLAELSEIMGLLGKKEAIPVLKEVLRRQKNVKNTWGLTKINLAIALVRLGDKSGIENLKNNVMSNSSHRDFRVRSARALIALGIKNVFTKEDIEKIDFNTPDLKGDWPQRFKELVLQLSS